MRLFYLIVMLTIFTVGCGTTEENTEPEPTVTISPTAVPTETTLPRSVKGDTQTRSSDGMVMVYVPAGEFVMGSNEEEVDFALQQCKAYGTNCQRRYFSVEIPMHSVVLDSFWIDRTEVTYGQYQQCLSTGTCDAHQGARKRAQGKAEIIQLYVLPGNKQQLTASGLERVCPMRQSGNTQHGDLRGEDTRGETSWRGLT
jgi:formylglycine-generating enzyme required for sulfatase activity